MDRSQSPYMPAFTALASHHAPMRILIFLLNRFVIYSLVAVRGFGPVKNIQFTQRVNHPTEIIVFDLKERQEVSSH